MEAARVRRVSKAPAIFYQDLLPQDKFWSKYDSDFLVLDLLGQIFKNGRAIVFHYLILLYKSGSYHFGEILEPAICSTALDFLSNPHSGYFFRSWRGRSLGGPHEVDQLHCFARFCQSCLCWFSETGDLVFCILSQLEVCHLWLGSKIFVMVKLINWLALVCQLSLKIFQISA